MTKRPFGSWHTLQPSMELREDELSSRRPLLGLLGGSLAVTTRVLRRITFVITHITGLVA